VELLERNPPLEIASRYYSAPEARYLSSSPAALRGRRFWELWTLKESYLKATGLGLSASLAAMTFDVARPGAITASPGADRDDPAERWWFGQWEASPRHIAALCVEHAGPRTAPELQLREIVPLRHEARLTAALRQTND
jgi:4'-phosphopantetheinyl transferase